MTLPLLRPLGLSLALLAGLWLPGCQPAPAPDESPAAAANGTASAQTDGEAAAQLDRFASPALNVTTLDGAHYDLGAQRGRWVVVNFWATWCAPCLKEMPELSALHAMREEINVIGLLAYDEITRAELETFLHDHPVSYPIAVLDPFEPPPDFTVPRGLPTTYLIAPDGRVARQFLGPVTAAQIEDVIARYAAADSPG